MRPALPLPEGNASEGKWWKGGRGKKKRKGRGKGEKIRKSETEDAELGDEMTDV